MTPAERLQNAARLFLDTAPVVYFVEANPKYVGRIQDCFNRLDQGLLRAVVSPVTLAECLIAPFRDGRGDLADAFIDLLTAGPATELVVIDREVALKGAELRARYNLSSLDAYQAAIALGTQCDTFLTNDAGMKRVKELPVILVDEIDIS